MSKRKRKSNEQIADQDAGPSTSNKSQKSTLIDDLNALSYDTFQSRFFNDASKTEHNHEATTWKITLRFSDDFQAALLSQCFKLIETTSRHDYEPSSFGWHPQRKKREMKEKEMRYLLLNETGPGSKFGGFISFMFTHDSTPAVPVLYIYEVHLTEAARGKGVGGFLMRVIQEVAKEAGVEKLMLTCFLSNVNALSFYRKLGFEVDVCSPEDRKTRNKVVKVDYVIMSKSLSEDGSGGEWETDEVTQNVVRGGSSLINANATEPGNRMTAAQGPSAGVSTMGGSGGRWAKDKAGVQSIRTQIGSIPSRIGRAR